MTPFVQIRLGDIGLTGLKLGGYNAGKPGGCEVRKLKLTDTCIFSGFQASCHSGFPANYLIGLLSHSDNK